MNWVRVLEGAAYCALFSVLGGFLVSCFQHRRKTLPAPDEPKIKAVPVPVLYRPKAIMLDKLVIGPDTPWPTPTIRRRNEDAHVNWVIVPKELEHLWTKD